MQQEHLDAKAISFLAADQSGYFEICDAKRRWAARYVTAPELSNQIGTLPHFGIVPRKALGGRSDADVIDEVRTLWVDLDPPEGANEGWKQATFNRLTTLDKIRPAVIVDSGRGLWAHWRLSTPVTGAEAKRLNQALAVKLNGDSVANLSRLARLPGSKNEKNGRRAYVMDFRPFSTAPNLLRDHLSINAPYDQDSKRNQAEEQPSVPFEDSDETYSRCPPLPDFYLAKRYRDYLTVHRTRYRDRELAHSEGVNRSEWEYHITVSLLVQGMSKEKTIAYFGAVRPPRFREEDLRQSNWFVDRVLPKAEAKAEMIIDGEDQISCKQCGLATDSPTFYITLYLYRGICTSCLDQVTRTNNKVLLNDLLCAIQDLGGSPTYTQLYTTLMERHEGSKSGVKGRIAQARDSGFVEVVQDPNRKNGKLYRISQSSLGMMEPSNSSGSVLSRLRKGPVAMKAACFDTRMPRTLRRTNHEAQNPVAGEQE